MRPPRGDDDLPASVVAVTEEEEAEPLELDLEEERRGRQRKTVHVWYVVFAAFAGLAIGVALLFVYFVHSSANSRAATCAVVAANRHEKQAQLQQYDANPPTSELARSLQQTYRESLASWERLWSTLGCKDAAPPGP